MELIDIDVICVDAKPRPDEDQPHPNDTFILKKDMTYTAVCIGEGICPNGKIIKAYGLLEDPFTTARGWNIDRFDIIPKIDLDKVLRQFEPVKKLVEEYSLTR